MYLERIIEGLDTNGKTGDAVVCCLRMRNDNSCTAIAQINARFSFRFSF